MRIALVSVHTSPSAAPGSGDAGGMNVVIAEQARALTALGHDVVVATRANCEVSPGMYEMGEARLVAIAAGPPNLSKGELPAILPEFARGLRELAPFDAVHAHYWLSGEAALPVARDIGCGLAITLHTVAAQKNAHLAPGDTPEPAVRLSGEERLAREAFVVAGSRSELTAIERCYGPSRLGSEVVHPGIDTGLFHPVPAGERSTAAPLRITVLGRVQPLKGQDLAVEAAGELARRDPELWRRCELIIAGQPTPGAETYAASLPRRARELGIADRVRFLPAQDRAETAQLLASSAVVLVPSHSETFGLVALEAAACGTPTVVGGHTGLVEAAPAGETAVHVDGRDPGEWASALSALLRDDAARRALGDRARAHALTHSWAAHAERLEAIYTRLR